MYYQDVVSAFLIAKRAANRSPKTIKWYQDQLLVFGAWIKNADIEEISTFDIESYMVAQQETGIEDSTLHARFRSLRAFFKWCTARKYLTENPIDPVEEPSIERKRPRHVSHGEYEAVVNSIPTEQATWLDHRDRLICHLLFWSGLRSDELVNLRAEHIHLSTQTATVKGKGKKERSVPISPKAPPALTAYLYSVPPWAGPNLFAASDGFGGVRGPLTNSGLRQMLRRRCYAAGIPVRLPHSWRHGFGITMLNHGADLSYLRDVMGHEDERTTRLYVFWLDQTISARFTEVYRRVENPDP